MTAWIARLMRLAGIRVDEVAIVVLPFEVAALVRGCASAELRWSAATGRWELIRTEVLNVRSTAYVQRGPGVPQ